MLGETKCIRFGWPAVAEPSGLIAKATVVSSSGSTLVGSAVKCLTLTTKESPSWIAAAGVITRSSPVRAKLAAWLSTVTLPTPLPPKSRSNWDSAWVARATMVIVPSMPWDGFLVA